LISVIGVRFLVAEAAGEPCCIVFVWRVHASFTLHCAVICFGVLMLVLVYRNCYYLLLVKFLKIFGADVHFFVCFAALHNISLAKENGAHGK
jgi:hypothetical protein